MRSYSIKHRTPTAADANSLGYVYARRSDGISYAGVKWDEVRSPKYDRWARPRDWQPKSAQNRGEGL